MKKFINLIFVVVFICVCHFSNAQFSFTDLGPPGGGSGGGAGGAAGAAGECEGNEFCQEVNAANAACDGLSGFIGNVNNVGSYFNVPIDIPTGRGGTDFCTMTSIGNGVVRAMCDPAWCGSMDPNEKVGLGNNSDNVHTAYFSLPYSIHFENLASAAAPAARVWVTDTLDAGKLDFSTFRFGQVQIGTDIMEQFAGNPLENFAIVNLRQSRGIDLKIETKFDPTTGIIKWYFASLDPTTYDVVEDPARGFLPPNTNGVEGAGSVTFFVDRKKLASGTEIRNRATITFDYNEPIRTTEWLVVVDTTRPESNVASLPPRSPSSFDLMWSGNDAHSGVSYYNIYVSENDGPYVLALRKTFGTTAVFNGTHGKKYEFLSLATDRAGNRELLPLNFLDEPDAVTVIDACINNSPEVILAHEVNCLYGGHASVDIDIRKGTQPFSFAWSSLETTQNISVSTAGFFEVTVTDVNNCTGSVNCNIANPSSWYEDFDTDGFGNVTNVVQDCAQPDGYVADNTDCNDDDITVHEPQQYFVDADHDGYGSATTEMVCSSIAAVGYSTNNTDCNDADITVHEPQQYFVDADHDGYGSTTTEMVCSSVAAVGYSTNNTDCNDGDITVHEPQQYFVDADHDGYGSTTTEMVCSSIAAVGYSTNNTDCNDDDITVHEPQQYFVDADHDGYGSTTTEMVCSSIVTEGYSTNNTDCNDVDVTVHEPQQYYVDGDRDGYGSTVKAFLCSSVAPIGYSTNNLDCNDNGVAGGAGVHPGAIEICNTRDDNCNGVIDEGVTTTFYRDADGDGFGNTAITIQACTSPPGYINNNADCNDVNASIKPNAVEICNGLDDNCNGATDEGVTTTFYRDADGDGFGNTAITIQACTAPPGYVNNNADCNDVDASIKPSAVEICNGSDDNCNGATDEGVTTTFYFDADGDGFGNAAITIQACSASPGYVSNNTDCNDASASVRPGGTEVCGNSTDDNCNGTVNEGCGTGCTMTVNAGIDEQTYYGYNADQSVTHTAIVNGGTAPFSYTWSLSRKLICNQVNTAGDELFTNGTCSANICPASDTSTTAAPTCFGSASISVTLMKDADICVRITDAAGCVANDCFHIISEDARCFAGNSGNSKVNVCHGTGSASNPWVQLCIAQTAVAAHLANNPGDYPGKCVKNSAKAEVETSETISETVRAYPNPFNDKLNIEFTLRKDSKVNLEIFNMAGQKLAEVFSGDLKANEKQKFEYLPAASCGCLVIYRLQTEYGAYYGRAMMLSAGSD